MFLNRSLRVSLAGGLLLTVAASAGAHHSDAGRYEETLTTVTGTVVEVQLINPHSVLILDVTDAAGTVVRWRGEMGAPRQLSQLGFGRDTVKVGDTITMRGRRLKNGSPYMTLSECARIFAADGTELFRGNDPGQPGGATGTGAADPCAGPIK